MHAMLVSLKKLPKLPSQDLHILKKQIFYFCPIPIQNKLTKFPIRLPIQIFDIKSKEKKAKDTLKVNELYCTKNQEQY